MSSVSLFRKWRSRTFEDLVGQAAVVRTLRNALSSGSPARAYLFCGPRGTGKTSTARIFAKALNCERGPTPDPCGACEVCRRIAEGSCLDVLEIDAASHTQVDKIREFIVDKVHFAPAEVRFKVYIIDEVHKLSSSSFNALLKTLEEPPAHVVFILATTHPQDLLPTILSRCQRHDFLRLTERQIREQLLRVAGSEGISLHPAAADLLARSSEGSLRDALVQLEQVSTFAAQEVGVEEVRTVLGLAGGEVLGALVDGLIHRDVKGLLELLNRLVGGGRDLGRLAGELIDELRKLLLISVDGVDAESLGVSVQEQGILEARARGLPSGRILGWLKAFMELQAEVRDPARARLAWEMALVRLTLVQPVGGLEGLEERVRQLERALAQGAGGALEAPRARGGGHSEPAERQPRQGGGGQGGGETAPPDRFVSGSGPPPSGLPPEAPPAAPELGVSVRTGSQGASERASGPVSALGLTGGRPVAAAPGGTSGGGRSTASPGPAAPSAGHPRSGVKGGTDPASVAEGWDAVTAEVTSAGSTPRQAGPRTPGAPRGGEGVAPGEDPAKVSQGAGEGAVPREGRAEDLRGFWQAFLEEVGREDKSLKAVLADAQPRLGSGGQVQLGFPGAYGWHCERARARGDLLARCAERVLGAPATVVCTLDELRSVPSGEQEHEQFVRRASQLFSGRIVRAREP